MLHLEEKSENMKIMSQPHSIMSTPMLLNQPLPVLHFGVTCTITHILSEECILVRVDIFCAVKFLDLDAIHIVFYTVLFMLCWYAAPFSCERSINLCTTLGGLSPGWTQFYVGQIDKICMKNDTGDVLISQNVRIFLMNGTQGSFTKVPKKALNCLILCL